MIARLTTLLAIACVAIPECRAQTSKQAEQVLREKLVIAYPTVTRWDISLLPPAMAEADSGSDPRRTATVTRLGQRSAVWIGSRSLGQDRHGTLLWFEVAGYSQAVVAARSLSARTSLDSGDGALAERDIVGGNCNPISDPRELMGKRAKRFLQVGEMICNSLLEPVPAVTRGEEVALLYIGRNFTLAAKAIAQADGIVGKRVTVRNASSGEVFAATVTGNGEVSVNE